MLWYVVLFQKTWTMMQGIDRIPDSAGHLVMKEDGAVVAVSKHSNQEFCQSQSVSHLFI